MHEAGPTRIYRHEPTTDPGLCLRPPHRGSSPPSSPSSHQSPLTSREPSGRVSAVCCPMSSSGAVDSIGRRPWSGSSKRMGWRRHTGIRKGHIEPSCRNCWPSPTCPTTPSTAPSTDWRTLLSSTETAVWRTCWSTWGPPGSSRAPGWWSHGAYTTGQSGQTTTARAGTAGWIPDCQKTWISTSWSSAWKKNRSLSVCRSSSFKDLRLTRDQKPSYVRLQQRIVTAWREYEAGHLMEEQLLRRLSFFVRSWSRVKCVTVILNWDRTPVFITDIPTDYHISGLG